MPSLAQASLEYRSISEDEGSQAKRMWDAVLPAIETFCSFASPPADRGTIRMRTRPCRWCPIDPDARQPNNRVIGAGPAGRQRIQCGASSAAELCFCTLRMGKRITRCCLSRVLFDNAELTVVPSSQP